MALGGRGGPIPGLRTHPARGLARRSPGRLASMRARRPAARLAPPGRRPQAGPEPGTATLGVLRGRGPCRLGIDAIGAGRSPNGELLFYRQNAIPGSAGAPVFDLEMDLVALNIGPDMMISGEEQRVAVGQRPTAFLERIRELGIVLPEPPGRSAGSPSPLPSSQV